VWNATDRGLSQDRDVRGRGRPIPRFWLGLAAILALVACSKGGALVDDGARLTDDITRALGIAKNEAKPLAEDLLTKFGDDADDVFRRYALDPPPAQGLDVARLFHEAKLREETQAIADIACNALFNFAQAPLLNADSLAAAMEEAVQGQLTETFRGRAYAAAQDVMEIADAYESGSLDQAQLEATQWLYCSLLDLE
jgi:hypothetical protein